MGLPLPDLLRGLLLALLFLGASVGHVCAVVASHNWWYAEPLRPRSSDAMQLLHGLLALAGPLVFWHSYGFDLTTAFRPPPDDVGRLLGAAYLSVCWLFGFVLLPGVTLVRRLRGRPAALVHNHTHTIDLAGRLGYRPAGDGKWRALTRLPGNQVFQVDFAEKLLRVPGLPDAWEGLSILHLSDLHFCGTPDRRFFQAVIDHCNDWQPDLIALTGDLVDSDCHRRWIVPVLGRLRWQVAAFAILGNHDYWYEPPLVRRRLRRCGFQVLGNGWVQITVRGEPLIVIGHEGPWFRPAPDLSGCPAEGFRLLLSHTPDHIRWAQERRINLMLSGHNHGGQVRLPLLGSVVVPSRYGRRYDCGTFYEPPVLLHVSRGLGGEHALRYNCRPEVAKLVLASVGENDPPWR
jgi:predicted MPP superfamily phosphohydrolase